MDIATVLGFILGAVFLLYGIFLGGPLKSFYDFPSILITCGGTFCAAMIQYPLEKFLNSFKTLKYVFTVKVLSPIEVIEKIIELANIARKEGLLALEEAAANVNDEFLRKGILLIVDGTDPELVRNILETEITFIESRHKDSQSVFETLASYGPAYGMIGTLIGLIQMLLQLDDPSALGPSMAVALVTTFYGCILANFVFNPIAGKLKIRSSEEIMIKEVMIEGLLSIQAGENPRIIEEKLKAFLAPALRDSVNSKKNARNEGVGAAI